MKKLLLFLLIAIQFDNYSQTTLISSGSQWKYLDNGSNQGTTWISSSFNDTSWAQGNAELGYGDGDEATVVSYGSSTTNRHITTYFRKTFSIATASFLSYTLKVKRDDGVAVFVNGNRVFTDNLPTGALYNTLASSTASDDGGSFQTTTLPANTFNTGNNTIAVEIHQSSSSSSDISFDLILEGNTTAGPPTQKHIRWGTTKNSLEGLTVSWTNSISATTDKIKWGYTTSYEQGESNVNSRTGYSVTTNKFFSFLFPGILNPNSTIYYSLYDSVSGTWSEQKTYITSPPINTTNFRFAALGDSRNNVGVWNNISNLTKGKNPAFTLFNGDIIDVANSNSQWNDWFDMGKNFLDSNLVYHAQGNHDEETSGSYYTNIFDLPKNNPANTELYYSVDYGEAIFICLNSEDAGNSTQLTWLRNTLAANSNKKWKIVSFHRPFYTVGTHAGEMDPYWNTWYKAFDDYGVDLVLNGHDHHYSRFKPMNRNVSTTQPVSSYGSEANQGRCNIVCGGAGAPLYTPSSSNLLQSYKESYHYLIFDVTSSSLCGTTYDGTNTIIDNFCINKTPLSTNENSLQIFYPIKVYPNPSKDYIKVEYTSPNVGKVTINIYDINGKLITSEESTKEIENFKHQFNISNLNKGIFVFEIQMKNQKDSSIFIRE